MTTENNLQNTLSKVFDLIGLVRNIKANFIIKYYLIKGKLKSNGKIKFYLCPDNCIMLIELNGNRVKSNFNIDIKLLEEINISLLDGKYFFLKGFNLQKSIYESDDKRQTGTFETITIPLNTRETVNIK
jgi:hypothetical protein